MMMIMMVLCFMVVFEYQIALDYVLDRSLNDAVRTGDAFVTLVKLRTDKRQVN